jgi:hypothetical protein
VVSVKSKGVARPRQIRSAKANESEPLMKGRKNIQTVSKPGSQDISGSSASEVLFTTGMTPGFKAARARIRLKHGTLEPVVSMQRERHKRRPREADSTDARHRDGTTRSSVERPVMGLERRGRVIQLSFTESTARQRGGGTYG